MKGSTWLGAGLFLILAPVFDVWAQATSAVPQASAPIIFRPETPSTLPSTQQWFVGALLCMVLLVMLLWWLRQRLQGSSPTSARRLAVLERCNLNPGTQLVIVRYGSSELLLAVGSHGVHCLSDKPAEPSP